MSFIFLLLCCACSKKIEVELPAYTPKLVVEMYLEDGAPLRCLLTESLPYNSSEIRSVVNNATVLFSDGRRTDTLQPAEVYEYASGRTYNFFNPRVVVADTQSVYTIKVIDSIGRRVDASTVFLPKITQITDVEYKLEDTSGRYSVGFQIEDPAVTANYYRFMIARRIDDFTEQNTDFFMADVSFDGLRYSYNSGAIYLAGDTVSVRAYTLSKEHFDYLQSTDNARTANFNPFVQPVPIRSNINNGLGIFCTVQYDERRIVIR